MSENANGIELILNKIREYGDQTARRIIDESTAKAQALYNEAKADSDSFLAGEQDGLKEEIRRIESQAETGYAAVERDRILALKQKMLAEAYKKAAEKLNELSDDEKLSLYRKWLLKYGEPSDYSVVMNKKDRDSFGDILASEMSRGVFPGHPSLSAFSADISGGLILDFGDSRTDVSFESVVNSEKGRYDMELINILFSEGQN